MKKFEEFIIQEKYKNISDIFTIPTFVDRVFDQLVNIICDEHQISEKDFTNWDNTTKYVRGYFDNNKEILLDIDRFKDKRYQLCAEYLYDKHFNNEDIIF